MLKRLLDAINRLFSEENKIDIRNLRYLPRWAVLFIDLLLVVVALVITYILLEGVNIKPLKTLSLIKQASLIIGVNFVFLLAFKTYAGLIRHSSFMDALKLLFATGTTFISLIVVNVISLQIIENKIFLTTGLFLFSLLTFSAQFIFRLAIKQLYESFKLVQKDEELIRAVIVGIDDGAISIAAALDIEHPQRFLVQGFVSKRQNKSLRILGKPVLEIDNSIHNIVKKLNASAIIFAGNTLNAEERFHLVKDCLEHDIKVYNSPLVINWSENTTVTDQLKSLQIEDLLNRDPINLNDKSKSKKIENKIVLVTGGAGSIGSEIARQVANYAPKKLIILDQAESPLHNLSLELCSDFPDLDIEFMICDVANRSRLRKLFEVFKIDLIYHAAAYKHVPLMESNPSEAILTNIYGTKNLADIAVKNKVSHFVMVSTDKAVNPTNVMGATKRAAEMYVQSKYFDSLENSKKKNTKFITTRFGNVLGSNGSVVPLFKKQIENGGPLTITHPDIIRYFMTIPEACQLVLEAGAMGKGGEIFIFDMGAPVRIMDLAEKMIKLAGYSINDEIEIKITGLRPGEKLYEELLSDKSKTLPTHHEKIMISEDVCGDYNIINELTTQIIKASLKNDNSISVAKLKKLVPEFRSNNSEFEILDISSNANITNAELSNKIVQSLEE
ncbi:polysaccharide biosynthesis protein [Dokdonia sp. Hel_I_53]|uniref:polysaccharide biosynthesis protein n=1 Tax=Dokdonia sp. Hel_I_53 TaxID=1566287 RepID=UPI00119A7972|nr:nucleoside-diphosphate sugar epimerase/dehydratase [Dokdonia sp. Hel_I_53]TVZ51354.1 FlaA1/EpsC-like NDP-sugar epimerase [Dokdonia sp. Hel_I_53]